MPCHEIRAVGREKRKAKKNAFSFHPWDRHYGSNEWPPIWLMASRRNSPVSFPKRPRQNEQNKPPIPWLPFKVQQQQTPNISRSATLSAPSTPPATTHCRPGRLILSSRREHLFVVARPATGPGGRHEGHGPRAARGQRRPRRDRTGGRGRQQATRRRHSSRRPANWIGDNS